MVGPADLPLILVVAVALFFEIQQESVNISDFLSLSPSSSWPVVLSLSIASLLPLPSSIFFYPLLPSFFCASSDPSYVISFIWSFRSFCLRISVFHNSLPPPLPLSSPFEFNHKIPLYYGTGPSFSLLYFFTPIYPHLTCERFTLHVIVIDFQNNDQRERLESMDTRQKNIEPRKPGGI